MVQPRKTTTYTVSATGPAGDKDDSRSPFRGSRRCLQLTDTGASA